MKILLISILVVAAVTSPVPSKRDNLPNRVLYDQRQEASSTPQPTLLDFLSKSVPKKKKFNQHHNKKDEIEEQTQHFIEAKTAPYHVDISSMRDHLERLHPEPIAVNGEEIVVAKSPAIALINNENGRNKRAFVLTINEDKDDDSGNDKKTVMEDELKLLGAEHEQCGPGLARDSNGVCQIVDN